MYDLQLNNEPAAIYLRISDDREGKRLGVKRQEKDCNGLVTRLGVDLKKIYSDNDISASLASTKPRDEFDEMLKVAKAGELKFIIAYSTSRLTRRPHEGEEIIELAVKYGVRVIYVASPYYDLLTADGRESYRRDVARDTGEVDRLQERILRKKLEDAENGKYPGGPRTYGIGAVLGVDPKSGKEVRDWTKLVDEEVEVLREMADRVLSGDSQMLVISSLNERGITTSKGCPWEVGKLKRTILNPSYVIFDPEDPEKRGTRVHGDTRFRAVWPGIFTSIEHDMLVNYFQNNPFSWQTGQVVSRRYMLVGFTECGSCGSPMTGQHKKYTTNKGPVSQRRYHCKKYNKKGEVIGCHKVFRIAEPVEKLVSDAVLYRFDSPEVHQALAPTENKERVMELTQTIAQLQKRKRDLAMEHAIEPYEDYGVMLTVIKDKMASAQDELNKLRTEKARKAMLPNIDNLREVWDGASIEWKSSVIRLLVKKVIIHPGRTGGKTYHQWRFDPDLVEIIWND